MLLKKKNYSKIKEIEKREQYVLYEYQPTLFHPLLLDFEPMRFVRRVRFLLEYLQKGKYLVYYLAEHDDFVAHCVVVPGGRKSQCTTEDDIVLGPYYVEKTKRGKGYSEILIKRVLARYPFPYTCAFDYIAKSNIPSIRASEKCGFKRYAELDVVGVMRTPLLVDSGRYIVYRYEKA